MPAGSDGSSVFVACLGSGGDLGVAAEYARHDPERATCRMAQRDWAVSLHPHDARHGGDRERARKGMEAT